MGSNVKKTTTTFIALCGVSSLCWAAGFDLKAEEAKVPALPATSVAAAASFPASHWHLEPDAPAFVAQIDQELSAASLSLNSPMAPAGTMSPADAQALGQRLQNMSEQERMAYAMQMQAQMSANQPHAGIVSPAQGQAMQQLGVEQQAIAADQQRSLAMRAAQQQFIDAWRTQDEQLTAANGDSEYVGLGGGSDFVCSEAARAANLKAYGAHLKLANEQLTRAVAMQKEQRAFADSAIARYQKVKALATQLASSPMGNGGNAMATGAFSNAALAIGTMSDFYSEAGRRAARWQHGQDAVRKLPVQSCETGG